MASNQACILIIVEGAKTDLRLMETLLDKYGILKNHTIVSYNTNIYSLYNSMFKDKNPDDFDLLNLLKENEKDISKKDIFNVSYSDIILIFDLDPQDKDFSFKKITIMQKYFVDSTSMGKLYVNYPMVEAFYHAKALPDNEYINYEIEVSKIKEYKAQVNRECIYRDYRKITNTKKNCSILINQNIIKANRILKKDSSDYKFVDLDCILRNQLSLISKYNCVSVLCTCCFYILDYNSNLLEEDLLENKTNANKQLIL